MRSAVISGLFVAGAVVLGLAAPAAAAPGYPAPDGRCVDQVGVLGDGMCAKVTEVLMADERATSDEIAVAVVPSTGDATIEKWGTGLFNAWGVGKKPKGNGVLLVVAVDDHRVRLATGTGMAKRLGPAAAKRIIDTTITPRFATDEYAIGVLAGLDEVRHALGHKVDSSLESLASTPATSSAELTGGSGELTGGSGEIPGGPGDLAVGFPETDDDTGAGLGILAVFGIGALALIGLAVAKGQGGGSDSSDDDSWRHSSHSSTSSSHSVSSFSSGSDSSSSSSSSSSSFGGGSSDGGGASGSW